MRAPQTVHHLFPSKQPLQGAALALVAVLWGWAPGALAAAPAHTAPSYVAHEVLVG